MKNKKRSAASTNTTPSKISAFFRKQNREIAASRVEPTRQAALERLQQAISAVSAFRLDPPAAPLSPADGREVLGATENLFRVAQVLTRVLPVVFEYVHGQRLYESAGYSSMRAYAAERLGVRSEGQFDKLSTAGKAAWDAFPEECRRVVGLGVAKGA